MMGSRYLETLGNKLWKHSAYLLSPRVLASDAKKARAGVNRIWLPTDRTLHSARFLPRTHLQLPHRTSDRPHPPLSFNNDNVKTSRQDEQINPHFPARGLVTLQAVAITMQEQ
jgi:hypothetical protein